jgi:hypothetical protein
VALRYIKDKPYYYESRREGGRVKSVYRGGGVVAVGIAAIEAAFREEREERRHERRAMEASVRDRDRQLTALCRVAAAAAAVALESLGYTQHARGAWRKRRMTTTPAGAPPAVSLPSSGEERLKIINRAERGDRDALPAFRELLARYPKTLVDALGMANRARDSLVTCYAGTENLAARDVYRREIDDLAAELAGPEPSPSVRLLAETCALNWFALRAEESVLSENRAMSGGSDLCIRLVDRRHRQWLGSVKSLALVKRLESGGSVRVTATTSQTLSVETTP